MSQKSNSSQRKSYYLPRIQLEDLLKRVGVVVAGDTGTDLIGYCPFHHNRDSPAFNISLSANHLWKCHNGKCAKQGNIVSLLMLKGYTKREADKALREGVVEVDDLLALVKSLMFEDKKRDAAEDWKGVSASKFREIDLKYGEIAKNYLVGRGITEEAVEFFQLGYSKAKEMAVIPVLSEHDVLVGTIGREIKSKRYQYSTGMNRGQLIWNINNAKQYDSIILTEGALDAVYLWQAGHENVGAVLGSSISPKQWTQLRKYFTEIICFFDNDDAGLALTDVVIDSVMDLSVYYVEYPDRMVEYVDSEGERQERPVKDPGELTTQEIDYMLDNRKSSLALYFEDAM